MTDRVDLTGIYGDLDTASLLSLVPLLERQASVVADLLRSATKSIDPEADAALAETTNETLVGLESLRDGSQDLDSQITEVQNKLRTELNRVVGGAEGRRQQYLAQADYLFEFERRRRWILDELTRRGLLPTPDTSLGNGAPSK